ncbi:RNA polymerase Rpb1 C-terminal repeat domain-containing protein [Histoplasma capsulatum]|uniref:RNA polymerase Rpb1 C-terminal repeat domain-containing protein n=1 Tax=Ajellomyces capsulatus TaxID=5037 RepID=A0A8A1MGN7_AJECA|nr:RNA polymerase Rpb1 C-terminal repeat domain-containing protein [Histoplasma capsulatum]
MCPRIYREPVHEDFTEDGEKGTQCSFMPIHLLSLHEKWKSPGKRLTLQAPDLVPLL